MSSAWVAAFVTLSVAVATSIILQVGALRRLMPLLEEADRRAKVKTAFRPRGLSPGDRLPRFELPSRNGGTLRSSDVDGPVVFLFVDDRCEPCHVLAAELSMVADLKLQSEFVVIFRDGSNTAEWERLSAKLFQDDGSVARAFDSNVIPHAFAIGRSQKVVANVVPTSFEHFRQLDQLAQRG